MASFVDTPIGVDPDLRNEVIQHVGDLVAQMLHGSSLFPRTFDLQHPGRLVTDTECSACDPPAVLLRRQLGSRDGLLDFCRGLVSRIAADQGSYRVDQPGNDAVHRGSGEAAQQGQQDRREILGRVTWPEHIGQQHRQDHARDQSQDDRRHVGGVFRRIVLPSGDLPVDAEELREQDTQTRRENDVHRAQHPFAPRPGRYRVGRIVPSDGENDEECDQEGDRHEHHEAHDEHASEQRQPWRIRGLLVHERDRPRRRRLDQPAETRVSSHEVGRVSWDRRPTVALLRTLVVQFAHGVRSFRRISIPRVDAYLSIAPHSLSHCTSNLTELGLTR